MIPSNLKNRFTFIEGKSIDNLPKILDSLKSVNIFFHDSEHTYENMMGEFQIVWPYLTKKGILISHDINWNDALTDFAKEKKGRPIFSKYREWGFILRTNREII